MLIVSSRYLLFLSIGSLGAMTLQLTSSPAGPQRVGTPITWTATANNTEAGTIDYQFSGRKGTDKLRVLRDFQASSQLVWAVTESEGTYTVRVIARDKSARKTASNQIKFDVTSRLTGDGPAINATANPLVALYSAPGCEAGASMHIRFEIGSKASTTNAAPCTPGVSMNFYIGGMLPGTTYNMSYVVTGPNQAVVTSSAKLPFTTGQVDSDVAFPPVTVLHPRDSHTCPTQQILLLDYLSPPGGPYYCPTAVDLQGRTIWYYPVLAEPAQTTTYFIRPVANSQGHMLLIANDPASNPDKGQILREIDLAGNTVGQTNAIRITEQLRARGKVGITGFDHDAIRLPNGHTLVICSQERIFPAGTQGSVADVNILANAIVDLDQNWQLTWSWSGYDYLDINRPAVLGEICAGAQPGCPPFNLSTSANDWLHGNSLGYIQKSGDILFSIRNQDWVIKIDYANGHGTGKIFWKLGLDGDFTMNSTDPYPWFSHQHDAHFETGTTILAVFDNGNTRAKRNPNMIENSRGYVLEINEANQTATPLLLTDLGVYSAAVGTAQRLRNGNYHFEAGFVKTPSNQAFAIEVLPDGSRDFECQYPTQTYRAYRMESLYTVGSERVVTRPVPPSAGQLGLDAH